MQYNIYFEVAAICYMLLLNLYIRLQYSDQSRQNKLFKRLALYVLIVVILDVVTAITISYAEIVPPEINMFLNFVYLSSLPLVEYYFYIYCRTGISKHSNKSGYVTTARIVAVANIALLIANFFTGWVFSFDPYYVHGPLYHTSYVVALFYIGSATGTLFRELKRFNRNQRITIILYSCVTLMGPLVQLLFPDILLSLFTVSLGFLMLMFSMETPDFHALNKTMEELARTRDEAEEAMGLAQAASQTKSDFLSSMSHELRTPINSILGFNEMIMQQTSDKEILKCADNVHMASMNLLSIISNILDYTDIDNGNLRVLDAPYSTKSMLRDVLAYAEYGTDKALLELKTFIDEEMPSELSGDITRVIQIFNNIVSNAVKYTVRGHIEVSIEWVSDGEDTGFIRATVKDTGIGIKKEDLTRISGSFTRFDKKRTQNIQGVGLGLTIVTKLITLMDGKISIESEYEKGTAVSFDIRQKVVNAEPVGKVSAYENDVADEAGYKFCIPDVRILTVDDNEMNRALFKGLLKDSDAPIDAASNGREAIEMLEKNSYDIIFLDHMMPIMDGIEALHIIRERGLDRGVPIIVLTANTVAGAREMYLAEGFDDYLAKPVTGRMLYNMIEKFMPADRIKPFAERVVVPEPEIKNVRKRTITERLSEFLDTVMGMTYCCDDKEFYVSMLETYTGSNRIEDMEKFFNEKDFDNYRITVHSIKSTSLTIGAQELSEEAKALEMAQKMGDIPYIEDNHQRVFEMYKEMVGKIKAVLDDPDDLLGEKVEGRLPEVLVVDDDVSCLSIAKRTLESSFTVITAGSGEAALQVLENRTPDLAVLDIYMPEMDGFELLRRIKRKSDMPVVFLTADSDKTLEEKCFREGAMDFITKPVTGTILINRLSRIIELDELKKRMSDR